MELSNRLKHIAEMVDNCDTVIDVGTDHGYIPIYLVKNLKCKKAIASDVNIGPINKVKFNVMAENLDDRIDCRHGSGLKVIKPEEVQCAVIAGMGGNLIRDIIEDSINVFKSLSYAILQPVQNPEVLRKYIVGKGFSIIDEDLCEEDGKYYEIIKVKFGNNQSKIKDIYYEVSPILIEKKHPLLEEFLNKKLEKYMKIKALIKEETQGAMIRKSEVEEKIDILEEMLSCL
jgi:Predicted SAM-dependent methyltransferase